jgi:hypothetical protein
MKQCTIIWVLLVVMACGGYGCKKTSPGPVQQKDIASVDTVVLLVDSVVGKYIMHGISTSSYVNQPTIVDTINADTISISAYNDSLVIMSAYGVPCSYTPGSITPYCFSVEGTSSGAMLVFYQNYPDSATFSFGHGTIEGRTYTVLYGRKM